MPRNSMSRVVFALLSAFILVNFAFLDGAAQGRDSNNQDSPPTFGVVKAIQGSAEVERPGEGPSPVQENYPLGLDELLTTSGNSKAWWHDSPDGQSGGAASPSDASLAQKSALVYVRADQPGSAQTVVGEVNEGMVRFIKSLPRTPQPSSFTLTTPTAVIDVIQADRPSDFVIEVVNDRKVTVYGIWGAVRVRNISDQFKEERIVRSCQKVDVEQGREPSPVMGASTQLLRDLIKKTTIPGTLPEDVPNCDSGPSRQITEPPPYYEDEIIPPSTCPCPPNHEYRHGRCVRCPSWRHFDPVTCSCGYRCRSDRECRRCERCEDGRCVPKRCPPGEWLNRDTCRCETTCRKMCPPGHWLNPRTCECERRCHKVCPPGQWLNPKTCECERKCDKRCPQGQWLNPTTCECQSRCDRKCPPGQTLNQQTCRCESTCNKQCPPHQYLNRKTCECETRCKRTCPPGTRLNVERCVCEGKPSCNKQCPDGFVLDRQSCECRQRPKSKGCDSDSDCGPNRRCVNGRCVQSQEPSKKPDHGDKPSKPDFTKPDRPGRPDFTRPSKPDHSDKPSKPDFTKPDRPGRPDFTRPSKPDHSDKPSKPDFTKPSHPDRGSSTQQSSPSREHSTGADRTPKFDTQRAQPQRHIPDVQRSNQEPGRQFFR